MKALVLALLLLAAPAAAHEWYEAQCCGGRDCEATSFCTYQDQRTGKAIEGIMVEGECAAIVWALVRPVSPPDGEPHVCIAKSYDVAGHEHQHPRCIYLPGNA